MPPTLKASIQGIIKVEQARNKKGWTKTDVRACIEASKILEPKIDWESEENKLAERFATGVSSNSWKRFLKGIPIRTESFKAFCKILELDYLDICKEDSLRMNICLDGIYSPENKKKILLKLTELEELFDVEPITLIELNKGSIVIKIKSSINGYKKILELAQSGQLSEILGFPIENIEIETVETTDVREWLESLFNNSWQQTETVLANSGIRSSAIETESSENTVSKAKTISLTQSESIAIVINFIYLSDAEIQSDIEIYPASNLTYLPEDLIVEIVDESGTSAIREEIGTHIDSVQIPFTFEPEEEFKIKLTLGGIGIVENLFDD